MHRLGIGALFGVSLLLLLAAMSPAGVFSADPDQVALVVQYADGQVETYCIAMEEDEISGAEVLIRSGLKLVVDTSRMGVTICQIQDVGCSYPAQACFCHCMGGSDCAYWNYFYRDPGETDWSYSALGAAMRRSRPGSVDAWVWGDGRTLPGDDLTFEAICLPPTPAATQTPARPTSLPLSATPAATASTPVPTRTPTMLPSATIPVASPTPLPVAAPSSSGYWPFALALAGLVAVGAFVWLRRG